MIGRVLIANRGEIGVRIIRACHDLGLEAVAVYSDADASALHVQMADHAVRVGSPSASKSYLSVPMILEAARSLDCTAVHPGYGFLSENSAFARAVTEAGLIWIGPPAEVIDVMGDKAAAREAALKADVAVVPGTGVIASAEEAVAFAETVGYPLLIKAVAGGGGKGIKRVDAADALEPSIGAAQREVAAAFGDPSLYLEKALTQVRHIEVQLLADAFGQVVHLYERECSLQRNRQKLVEEAPAASISAGTRANVCDAAVRLAQSVGYQSAGTVEFLVDRDGQYYFIEMNTRVQVEHGVTEVSTGLDIVESQIRIAFGERLSFSQDDVHSRGSVIELRINAESPEAGFRGSPGLITQCRLPSGPGVRVDTGVEVGQSVQPYYDSMVAKVLVSGADRDAMIRRARRALDETRIVGVDTTVDFLAKLLRQDWFESGEFDTNSVENYLTQTMGTPK